MSPRQTKRRKIKGEMARLKRFKASLPMLIDCSEVYGDGYFSEKDRERIDTRLKELEAELSAV